MNQNFSYHMPTKIVFGINELENISKYIDGSNNFKWICKKRIKNFD